MVSNSLSRRRVLQTLGPAALGMGLVSCGGSQGTSGDTTVRFWNTFPTSSEVDTRKKPEEFWISKSLQRFGRQADVRVDLISPPGGVETITKFRTAGVARNGPDAAMLWTGSYFMAVKDFLEPLDDYITEEERKTITGWAPVTEGFNPGEGKTYAYPTGNDGVMVFFFDRRALDRAGVKENPSGLYWEEWIDLLGRLKSTGITPLALRDTSYTLFALNYWIAQVVDGNTGIPQLSSGQRDFSDPAIEKVVNKWLQLRDYTLPGTPRIPSGQPQSEVAAGNAAGLIQGAGDIYALRQVLGENLVMATLPNIQRDVAVKDSGIGGTGDAVVVTNYSEHKDQAVELIKHLVSKPEQQKRLRKGEPPIPNIRGLDPSAYEDPLLKEQYRLSNGEVIYWPDNIWSTPLVSELQAQAELTWDGKIAAAEFLERLDKKRDELLSE